MAEFPACRFLSAVIQFTIESGLMVCRVGRQLAEAFVLAARQYADTAAKLGRLSTTNLDPARLLRDEEETLRWTEEALRAAEASRAALEAHIHEHRCDERAARTADAAVFGYSQHSPDRVSRSPIGREVPRPAPSVPSQSEWKKSAEKG